MSEDLSSPSKDFPDDSFEGPSRRSSTRNGSGEGGYGSINGRSLVGEGLRAAGLTKRRDEDVFSSSNGSTNQAGSSRRTRSTGNSSVVAGGETDSSFDRSDEGSRIEEGVGPPRDPKTPFNANFRLRPQSSLAPRPGTSMAALHHDEAAPPRTAPSGLRSYRSTYSLADRSLENLQRQVPVDRSSPFGTVRSPTAQSGANSDHRRLMMDALSVFESHLSRLPPMGQTTTTTIPEVFQSAQHLVHALDKLNGMLKEGTNKALEAQIDAELADYGGNVDLPELWREVGMDHRENLRVSDEVVRNMTGFLLGVGKILRDASSTNQHLRTLSLDEEVVRRATPDIQVRDMDGRRSRELRRSWEPGKETARLTLTSLERNGTTRSRPGSSLNIVRSSNTSSSEGRSESDANDGTPATLRQSAPVSVPTSLARRLYTPRERVDSQPLNLPDYDPPPTPLTRQSNLSLSDRRPFPSVAPTLSTLPSESLISQNGPPPTDVIAKRKISASSNLTIRPEPTPFTPSIKPSNPTTALSHTTVSISPETANKALPVSRSNSNSSSRSNGVTFSRVSSSAVSFALSGLQQQHERDARNRNVSMQSVFADEGVSLAPAANISSLSGSESERENRSRTISSRPRASLEGSRGQESPVDAVRRSLATTVSYSTQRKERRRTITEIFSQR